MNEVYTGVKFDTIFVEKRRIKNKKANELIFWAKKFSDAGLMPSHSKGSYGNLSFKTRNGFIITKAGKRADELKIEDLVNVVDCDLNNKKVYCIGLFVPSSETFLHWMIYKERKNIKAIFHGHDKIVLENAEKLNLLITEKEQSYGTLELCYEVLKILGKSKYLVMRNHGFISLGESMDEAGMLAIEVHEKAKNFSLK